jgi:hypothetical protein
MVALDPEPLDAYPAVPFTIIGQTDPQALQSHVENDLGGLITAA